MKRHCFSIRLPFYYRNITSTFRALRPNALTSMKNSPTQLTMLVHRLALLSFFQVIAVSPLAVTISSYSLLSQCQSLSLNATQPVNTTDKYYVECLPITNPRQPKLSTGSCGTAVFTICSKLSFPQPRRTARGRWQWTTLPGCSLGYYIPEDAPAALIPNKEECEGDIFGRIIKQCGSDPRYNTGVINVDYPPTPLMPGFPVTAGNPRYIMAPSELDTRTSS